jgi:hypothetical protein
MSEHRDGFDEDHCKTSYSPTPSVKRVELAVYRSCNDLKGELESIKAEQEQKNEQLTEELNQWKEGFKTIFEVRFTTLSESILSKNPSKTEVEAQNDERFKTLEEEVSRLKSKLNRSRAFELATIVIAVLFLIQANWTSLTHGIDTLVSLAGIGIETFKSNAALFLEFVASMAALLKDFVVSMAALFRDYLVSKAADVVTSAAEEVVRLVFVSLNLRCKKSI